MGCIGNAVILSLITCILKVMFNMYFEEECQEYQTNRNINIPIFPLCWDSIPSHMFLNLRLVGIKNIHIDSPHKNCRKDNGDIPFYGILWIFPSIFPLLFYGKIALRFIVGQPSLKPQCSTQSVRVILPRSMNDGLNLKN